ncbi:sarcosine oxidase [Pseudomonas nabeulensis]|uniref:Sarcosine oxidase n=1 Tax=Pseudomonas nabeulensis TaxID=2293833 RepID=A0A4Z0B993_9PSED|nr:sarcosine oxidase subunit gamma family protein [Pseudomonas nabeulensis]TFY95615.1 sarcosine oxidase [Pseudomonas nabeulensis]
MNNLERSPLHSVHGDAALTSFGGKPFVDAYANENRACGLVDLANLHRVGFRGAQAAEFLSGKGFNLPQVPNTAVRQPGGEWIARLSMNEYFLLGALNDGGERLAQLETGWTLSQQANYCLPRQDSHTCLALFGARISEVMAKLCGVDLSASAFAPGSVAQTSVARVNGIVVNTGTDDGPCFHLLFDRASAHYLWHVLIDALQEFDGAPAGVTALPR